MTRDPSGQKNYGERCLVSIQLGWQSKKLPTYLQTKRYEHTITAFVAAWLPIKTQTFEKGTNEKYGSTNTFVNVDNGGN